MSSRPMSSSSWSAERITLLRQLWRDGSSAAEIARALGGVTRNAVIGKVHRLGLAERRPPSAPRRPARVRAPAPAPASASVRRASGPQPPAPPRPPAAAVRVQRPAPPAVEAIARVWDATGLTARTCRWPIGDPKIAGFGFCGDAVQGAGPYCANHHALACPPRLQRPVAAEMARARPGGRRRAERDRR